MPQKPCKDALKLHSRYRVLPSMLVHKIVSLAFRFQLFFSVASAASLPTLALPPASRSSLSAQSNSVLPVNLTLVSSPSKSVSLLSISVMPIPQELTTVLAPYPPTPPFTESMSQPFLSNSTITVLLLTPDQPTVLSNPRLRMC